MNDAGLPFLTRIKYGILTVMQVILLPFKAKARFSTTSFEFNQFFLHWTVQKHSSYAFLLLNQNVDASAD